MRELRWIAACVIALGLVAWGRSCDDAGTIGTTPQDRVVSLTTTACGDASKTSGAGVVVGPGQVLVAAHVVIGASDVVVSLPSGSTEVASVVMLDTDADLALLEVAGAQATPVVVSTVATGDRVFVAGGGPSGAFDADVTRRVEVRIEGVRSTERTSRFGFEIDRRVELGDSGAGVFNARGDLVGVVFGRSQSRPNASFVVRKHHIDALLAETTDGGFVCDPDQSRIAESSFD